MLVKWIFHLLNAPPPSLFWINKRKLHGQQSDRSNSAAAIPNWTIYLSEEIHWQAQIRKPTGRIQGVEILRILSPKKIPIPSTKCQRVIQLYITQLLPLKSPSLLSI